MEVFANITAISLRKAHGQTHHPSTHPPTSGLSQNALQNFNNKKRTELRKAVFKKQKTKNQQKKKKHPTTGAVWGTENVARDANKMKQE